MRRISRSIPTARTQSTALHSHYSIQFNTMLHSPFEREEGLFFDLVTDKTKLETLLNILKAFSFCAQAWRVTAGFQQAGP